MPAQPKEKKNALTKLAERLDLNTDTMRKTLMATAFVNCKDEAQFVAGVVVANTYGLNPLTKEMTVFPGKNGGVIPVVMIDGWIKLVNRQDNYDGVEIVENKHPEGKTNKSGTDVDSVTVKFYLKNRTHPVIVTEYMEECWDPSKEPWKRWPRRMLRHKAYIQGARVAFGFAGIYDEDEKDRMILAEETTAVVEPVIGLKHDKNAPAAAAQQQEPAKEEGAVAAEIVDDEFKFASLDPARFGADSNKAKFMGENLAKAAKKLGKEKFLAILGQNSFSCMDEILKFKDLVKVTNIMLEELKKVEDK